MVEIILDTWINSDSIVIVAIKTLGHRYSVNVHLNPTMISSGSDTCISIMYDSMSDARQKVQSILS
jgi:hypothetical protein